MANIFDSLAESTSKIIRRKSDTTGDTDSATKDSAQVDDRTDFQESGSLVHSYKGTTRGSGAESRSSSIEDGDSSFELDSLTKFTIPKRKKSEKDLLESVLPESIEFKDVLQILRQSYKDRQSKYKYTCVKLIHTSKLVNDYQRVRKEWRKAGYTDKEVSESYGFLFVDTDAQVTEICSHGLKNGNVTSSVIGDPAFGVLVCRHADVLGPTEGNGKIIIFKLMKGKVKLMPENKGSHQLEPDPMYNCHVSKTASIDMATTSLEQAHHSTQILLYEYDIDTMEVVERPRQIIPHAVLDFTTRLASSSKSSTAKKSNSIKKRQPSKPETKLSTSQSSPSSDCNVVWSGMLTTSRGGFSCEVELVSYIGVTLPAKLGSTIVVDKNVPYQTVYQRVLEGLNHLDRYKEMFYNNRSHIYCELRAAQNSEQRFRRFTSTLHQSSVAAVVKYDNTTIIMLPECDITRQLGLPSSQSGILHCIFICSNVTYSEVEGTKVAPGQTSTVMMSSSNPAVHQSPDFSTMVSSVDKTHQDVIKQNMSPVSKESTPSPSGFTPKSPNVSDQNGNLQTGSILKVFEIKKSEKEREFKVPPKPTRLYNKQISFSHLQKKKDLIDDFDNGFKHMIPANSLIFNNKIKEIFNAQIIMQNKRIVAIAKGLYPMKLIVNNESQQGVVPKQRQVVQQTQQHESQQMTSQHVCMTSQQYPSRSPQQPLVIQSPTEVSQQMLPPPQPPATLLNMIPEPHIREPYVPKYQDVATQQEPISQTPSEIQSPQYISQLAAHQAMPVSQHQSVVTQNSMTQNNQNSMEELHMASHMAQQHVSPQMMSQESCMSPHISQESYVSPMVQQQQYTSPHMSQQQHITPQQVSHMSQSPHMLKHMSPHISPMQRQQQMTFDSYSPHSSYSRQHVQFTPQHVSQQQQQLSAHPQFTSPPPVSRQPHFPPHSPHLPQLSPQRPRLSTQEPQNNEILDLRQPPQLTPQKHLHPSHQEQSIGLSSTEGQYGRMMQFSPQQTHPLPTSQLDISTSANIQMEREESLCHDVDYRVPQQAVNTYDEGRVNETAKNLFSGNVHMDSHETSSEIPDYQYNRDTQKPTPVSSRDPRKQRASQEDRQQAFIHHKETTQWKTSQNISSGHNRVEISNNTQISKPDNVVGNHLDATSDAMFDAYGTHFQDGQSAIRAMELASASNTQNDTSQSPMENLKTILELVGLKSDNTGMQQAIMKRLNDKESSYAVTGAQTDGAMSKSHLPEGGKPSESTKSNIESGESSSEKKKRKRREMKASKRTSEGHIKGNQQHEDMKQDQSNKKPLLPTPLNDTGHQRKGLLPRTLHPTSDMTGAQSGLLPTPDSSLRSLLPTPINYDDIGGEGLLPTPSVSSVYGDSGYGSTRRLISITTGSTSSNSQMDLAVCPSVGMPPMMTSSPIHSSPWKNRDPRLASLQQTTPCKTGGHTSTSNEKQGINSPDIRSPQFSRTPDKYKELKNKAVIIPLERTSPVPFATPTSTGSESSKETSKECKNTLKEKTNTKLDSNRTKSSVRRENNEDTRSTPTKHNVDVRPSKNENKGKDNRKDKTAIKKNQDIQNNKDKKQLEKVDEKIKHGISKTTIKDSASNKTSLLSSKVGHGKEKTNKEETSTRNREEKKPLTPKKDETSAKKANIYKNGPSKEREQTSLKKQTSEKGKKVEETVKENRGRSNSTHQLVDLNLFKTDEDYKAMKRKRSKSTNSSTTSKNSSKTASTSVISLKGSDTSNSVSGSSMTSKKLDVHVSDKKTSKDVKKYLDSKTKTPDNYKSSKKERKELAEKLKSKKDSLLNMEKTSGQKQQDYGIFGVGAHEMKSIGKIHKKTVAMTTIEPMLPAYSDLSEFVNTDHSDRDTGEMDASKIARGSNVTEKCRKDLKDSQRLSVKDNSDGTQDSRTLDIGRLKVKISSLNEDIELIKSPIKSNTAPPSHVEVKENETKTPVIIETVTEKEDDGDGDGDLFVNCQIHCQDDTVKVVCSRAEQVVSTDTSVEDCVAQVLHRMFDEEDDTRPYDTNDDLNVAIRTVLHNTVKVTVKKENAPPSLMMSSYAESESSHGKMSDKTKKGRQHPYKRPRTAKRVEYRTASNLHELMENMTKTAFLTKRLEEGLVKRHTDSTVGRFTSFRFSRRSRNRNRKHKDESVIVKKESIHDFDDRKRRVALLDKFGENRPETEEPAYTMEETAYNACDSTNRGGRGGGQRSRRETETSSTPSGSHSTSGFHSRSVDLPNVQGPTQLNTASNASTTLSRHVTETDSANSKTSSSVRRITIDNIQQYSMDLPEIIDILQHALTTNKLKPAEVEDLKSFVKLEPSQMKDLLREAAKKAQDNNNISVTVSPSKPDRVVVAPNIPQLSVAKGDDIVDQWKNPDGPGSLPKVTYRNIKHALPKKYSVKEKVKWWMDTTNDQSNLQRGASPADLPAEQKARSKSSTELNAADLDNVELDSAPSHPKIEKHIEQWKNPDRPDGDYDLSKNSDGNEMYKDSSLDSLLKLKQDILREIKTEEVCVDEKSVTGYVPRQLLSLGNTVKGMCSNKSVAQQIKSGDRDKENTGLKEKHIKPLSDRKSILTLDMLDSISEAVKCFDEEVKLGLRRSKHIPSISWSPTTDSFDALSSLHNISKNADRNVELTTGNLNEDDEQTKCVQTLHRPRSKYDGFRFVEQSRSEYGTVEQSRSQYGNVERSRSKYGGYRYVEETYNNGLERGKKRIEFYDPCSPTEDADDSSRNKSTTLKALSDVGSYIVNKEDLPSEIQNLIQDSMDDTLKELDSVINKMIGLPSDCTGNDFQHLYLVNNVTDNAKLSDEMNEVIDDAVDLLSRQLKDTIHGNEWYSRFKLKVPDYFTVDSVIRTTLEDFEKRINDLFRDVSSPKRWDVDLCTHQIFTRFQGEMSKVASLEDRMPTVKDEAYEAYNPDNRRNRVSRTGIRRQSLPTLFEKTMEEVIDGDVDDMVTDTTAEPTKSTGLKFKVRSYRKKSETVSLLFKKSISHLRDNTSKYKSKLQREKLSNKSNNNTQKQREFHTPPRSKGNIKIKINTPSPSAKKTVVNTPMKMVKESANDKSTVSKGWAGKASYSKLVQAVESRKQNVNPYPIDFDSLENGGQKGQPTVDEIVKDSLEAFESDIDKAVPIKTDRSETDVLTALAEKEMKPLVCGEAKDIHVPSISSAVSKQVTLVSEALHNIGGGTCKPTEPPTKHDTVQTSQTSHPNYTRKTLSDGTIVKYTYSNSKYSQATNYVTDYYNYYGYGHDYSSYQHNYHYQQPQPWGKYEPYWNTQPSVPATVPQKKSDKEPPVPGLEPVTNTTNSSKITPAISISSKPAMNSKAKVVVAGGKDTKEEFTLGKQDIIAKSEAGVVKLSEHSVTTLVDNCKDTKQDIKATLGPGVILSELSVRQTSSEVVLKPKANSDDKHAEEEFNLAKQDIKAKSDSGITKVKSKALVAHRKSSIDHNLLDMEISDEVSDASVDHNMVDMEISDEDDTEKVGKNDPKIECVTLISESEFEEILGSRFKNRQTKMQPRIPYLVEDSLKNIPSNDPTTTKIDHAPRITETLAISSNGFSEKLTDTEQSISDFVKDSPTPDTVTEFIDNIFNECVGQTKSSDNTLQDAAQVAPGMLHNNEEVCVNEYGTVISKSTKNNKSVKGPSKKPSFKNPLINAFKQATGAKKRELQSATSEFHSSKARSSTAARESPWGIEGSDTDIPTPPKKIRVHYKPSPHKGHHRKSDIDNRRDKSESKVSSVVGSQIQLLENKLKQLEEDMATGSPEQQAAKLRKKQKIDTALKMLMDALQDLSDSEEEDIHVQQTKSQSISSYGDTRKGDKISVICSSARSEKDENSVAKSRSDHRDYINELIGKSLFKSTPPVSSSSAIPGSFSVPPPVNRQPSEPLPNAPSTPLPIPGSFNLPPPVNRQPSIPPVAHGNRYLVPEQVVVPTMSSVNYQTYVPVQPVHPIQTMSSVQHVPVSYPVQYSVVNQQSSNFTGAAAQLDGQPIVSNQHAVIPPSNVGVPTNTGVHIINPHAVQLVAKTYLGLQELQKTVADVYTNPSLKSVQSPNFFYIHEEKSTSNWNYSDKVTQLEKRLTDSGMVKCARNEILCKYAKKESLTVYIYEGHLESIHKVPYYSLMKESSFVNFKLFTNISVTLGDEQDILKSGAVIIPESDVIYKLSNGILQMLFIYMKAENEKGIPWIMKVHSSIVSELEKYRNISYKPPQTQDALEKLKILYEYKGQGLVEIMESHDCDTSKLSSSALLDCMLRTEREYITKYRMFYLLIHSDAHINTAECKTRGIGVMTVKALIEKLADKTDQK